jgi:hypothetical protein
MNQADTMANSAAASHSCGDSGGEVKTTTKPRLSSTTEGDNTSCGQQPLPSETASLEQEAFNQKALAQLYHSSRRSRHFRRVSTSSAHAAYDKKLNQEKQLHHDTSHHHQVPAVEEENHTEPSADDVGWSFNIASLVDECSSISSFGDESAIAVDDGGGIFHLESPDRRSARKMENSSSSSTSGEPEGDEGGLLGTSSSAEGRSQKRAKMTS